MKFRLVVADLFHADGRTDGRTNRQKDMAELIIVFRHFANVSKQLLFFAILVRRTNHTVWGKCRWFLC